jgi:hypothetical protein
MLRVFRKMTPEEWKGFELIAWKEYFDNNNTPSQLEYSEKTGGDIGDYWNEIIPDYTRWLMIENPERALCLVADWIMKRGKGCRDLKYHAANAAGAVSEDTRREP